MPRNTRKRKQPPTAKNATRPKKRRKTTKNTNTNQRTNANARSARLQARNARKANQNNTNNTNDAEQTESVSRRRSSRLQNKIEQKAKKERQRQRQRQRQIEMGNDIDITSIAESIHELDGAHMSSIYEPLPPPQRYFDAPSTDYMSLQSQLELGHISAEYFREKLFENQVTSFWNGITNNQYKLAWTDAVSNRNSADKKINAFTLHDQELLAFSGDKAGFLSMTNFKEAPYQNITVPIHDDKITDIHTCERHPLYLYSSSVDGTVKVMDLTRIPNFQLAQNDQDRFDYGNHNTTNFGDSVINNRGNIIHGFDLRNAGREIYAVDDNGMLLFVDIRTNQQLIYQIAEKKIATIRINPLNQNYFVMTENRYKTIQLWDFRMLNDRQCVHQRQFNKTQKNINFSADGQRLLTAGRDDFIRVYDQPLLTFDKYDHSIRHNNNTGIWICDFKPVFHPIYNEIVLTGDMSQKGIDVIYFKRDGVIKSRNIKDLSKVKSVHTFGAVHSRSDDYLFGVTYNRLVFYKKNDDLNDVDI